jgi:N-acetylmuramoyl-L-alanine amidase
VRRNFRLTIRPVLVGTVCYLGACAPALQPRPVEPEAATPPPSVEPAAIPPSAGLPPVPAVEGPLAIAIVHPPAGVVRPEMDSVLVYGSVGSGRATLTINGASVPVQPNGAFLAFLPRPPDDALFLEAREGDRTVQTVHTYRPPPPPPATGGTPVVTTTYPSIRTARVSGGADTVATGSEPAIGRPSPTGIYRWFLPNGAKVELTGERADMVRARLDSATEAWFPRSAVELEAGRSHSSVVGSPLVLGDTRWTDVQLPVDGAPFHVEATDSMLEVTIHGVDPTFFRMEADDGVVALVEVHPKGSDAVTMRIFPTGSIWGFKTFYGADGRLVVRVRPPPSIDPSAPLRGIRVAVDPGHPPGGAPGPTGLSEAEANLAIGLRVAALLRDRGAEVLLTRSTDGDVALTDRVDMAVDWNADLLVSIHNNAFPEGANPFRRNGTSSYFFHPMSADLARAMNEAIVATTQIRDLGAIHGNLALVRPMWMPSVLTESLFMPIPEQESALRDGDFLDRLAAAHVRGLEAFLRQRAGR